MYEELAVVRESLAAYSSSAVGERLFGREAAWAPTCVVRRNACLMEPPRRADALDTMIALFALGASVPLPEARAALGRRCLGTLESLGLTSRVPGEGSVASAVAISPLGDDLLVCTDFAPPCHVSRDQPCMYVGPDSAALADVVSVVARGRRACDLCAGSGVQSLVALGSGATAVLAVEREPRAAGFCRLNRALNARRLLEEPRSSRSRAVLDDDDDRSFDLVAANPPFVAVPGELGYEAFADGGASGEAVIRDVVKFAADHLADGGLLIVVCEIHHHHHHHHGSSLVDRIAAWWDAEDEPEVVVLREPPDPTKTPAAVAARRCITARSRRLWIENLERQGIDFVSNGFIFIRRRLDRSNSKKKKKKSPLLLEAPRLWAMPPTNVEARSAARRALDYLQVLHD
ncbi:hypothetical protein CTAYLR_002503 [Chrysophaeum taylorii]|uniref:Methyltransferase small domain-containing protein n=1 Tax=Chrysophaeum taylorii TaxID=2483200 RepID=A0AAD7UEX6_9STRA|nr:hypothetical protein CTAYLR_002503 [Chrysophaeum taylorii]